MPKKSAVNRLAGKVAETSEQGVDKSRQIVGKHPLPWTLAAFGLGAGAGLALAGVILEFLPGRKRSWAERFVDDLRDALSRVSPKRFS